MLHFWCIQIWNYAFLMQNYMCFIKKVIFFMKFDAFLSIFDAFWTKFDAFLMNFVRHFGWHGSLRDARGLKRIKCCIDLCLKNCIDHWISSELDTERDPGLGCGKMGGNHGHHRVGTETAELNYRFSSIKF